MRPNTTPDPTSWADPDWRDNLGESDTFGDDRPVPDPAEAGTVTVRRPPGRPAPAAQDPPPVGHGEAIRGPLWPSVGGECGATSVFFI
jgi:hypothetical protein